jgi:hypothetical protein
VVTPALGPAGQVAHAEGVGFTPGAVVELEWEPGTGGARVQVGPHGRFRVGVLVQHRDVPGPRALLVVGAPGVRASYLVVPDTLRPGGSGRRVRFGR